MKVTVVVPVYNTGPYVDACVQSLLSQTMRPGDYEVIFVDDGSTDGTGARLDAVAAEHEHLRVIHINNTGGPGTPRNLGIEAAKGEYIYFLDDDDWLGAEALERMYAMAVRNDADIVIGKMVGHNRGVPKAIFRESRDNADIQRDHLLSILTPHKLFRAALISKHQIRFPEGPVRLEDHRFVITAYLNAQVISVLADYACCHWIKRDNGQNYSSRPFDPVSYFEALREVLDIVDEHVPPGVDRDRLYAHWLRAKILKRLGAGTFLWYDPDYRHEMYKEMRRIVLERFSPAVDAWLPAHMRVRAALLRADGYDDLARLADAERAITVRPMVEEMRWDDDRLLVRVTAIFTYRDGEPVAFRRSVVDGRERLLWELPVKLQTPVPAEALDVTDQLAQSRLDIAVRHRETRADFCLPVASELVTDDGRRRYLTLTADAWLDVDSTLVGNTLDPGIWDYVARLDACGWIVQRRLGALRSTSVERATVGGYAGKKHRLVVPYWTEKGNLSAHLEPASVIDVVTAAVPAATLHRTGRRLRLTIPVPSVPGRSMRLRLVRTAPSSSGQPEITVNASFEPAPVESAAYGPSGTPDGPGRLVAMIPTGFGPGRAGLGTWRLEVHDGDEIGRFAKVLDIAAGGRAWLRWSGRGQSPAANINPSTLRRVARRVPGLRRAVRKIRAA